MCLQRPLISQCGLKSQLCLQDAIEACYSILNTVQRLWRKVKDEDDDDYIAIPKPSGYQSLHTAVIGEAILSDI